MRSLLRRMFQRPAANAPHAVAGHEHPESASATAPAVLRMPRDRRVYGGPDARSLERLRRDLPALCDATVHEAERVLAHEFRLLGTGPFVPIDAQRATRPDGYRPIDWVLDARAGCRFPSGFPYKTWNPDTMRPAPDADIKLPWELARCQHLPCLAQAWQLTGDVRFAREIADQIDDFMEANPVGSGVNWLCTMDVAIRAFNWAVALDLAGGCAELQGDVGLRAYGALFDHGAFIFANLENHYEVTSNHFLSNVVGLYCLSAVFGDAPEALRWNEFCRSALEQEMRVQVLPDGADFESSVPYHRLVAELFLGAARLAERVSAPLSDSYLATLGRMIDFVVGVMRPDGLMPQLGDADDGRLHVFTRYGSWQPQDARHLLGPAGMLLGRNDLIDVGGIESLWEAAWWGYDVSGESPVVRSPEDHATLYPDAGIAVVRSGGCYLAVTNGIVGTKGFGNHKHNDQLGFEFHAHGRALLVDPGSHVYTCDPESRNLFRSTGVHNTLQIDGVEQNEFRPEWLFRMFEKADPEHLGFAAAERFVEYRGRHKGYARLPHPVIHERTLRVFPGVSTLLVVDRLVGSGPHTLRWHFHLAPRVEVVRIAADGVRIRSSGVDYEILPVPELPFLQAEGWYSPSYGVRDRCVVLDASTEVPIDGDRVQGFIVRPCRATPADAWTAIVAGLRGGCMPDQLPELSA